ncbi:MAG TPA: hypothetical protein VI278_17125 [Nitrososphaeraceae archaeon]
MTGPKALLKIGGCRSNLASSNSHYDECLRELKEKGQRLASQYIVELYSILRDEEKLPLEDCRAKIEQDCLHLWSRATIRKYLPPEAKDFKKQAAGKVGSENKKNKNALLLVAQTENGARTNLAEGDSVSQKEEEARTSFYKELDQQLSSRTVSPDLLEASKIIAEKDDIIEELRKENEELLKQQNPTSHGKSIDIQKQTQIELESELTKKDALIKELELKINHLEEQLEANDDGNENSTFPCTSNDQHENATIDFDMSLPFEDVRIHMESIFKKDKGLGKVSFYGRLNLKTSKVIAVSIGSMTEEDKDEDFTSSDKDDKV